jgi:6-phosphogluconolactonase
MMSVKIFKNIKVLSEKLDKELTLLSNSGSMSNIAIPGGNTPRKIFEILSLSETITWDNIRIFWTDERCVPPDDNDSNYLLAKKTLFDKIKIPDKNIFRIKGEENPEEEADRYSSVITRIMGNTPELDLILAGIGIDGHTASIFPGQENLFYSANNYDVSNHPGTDRKRITAAGKILFNAKKIIFCVTGKDKSEVISNIIENNFQCPSSIVLKKSKNSFLYLDEEAASFLKKQKIEK